MNLEQPKTTRVLSCPKSFQNAPNVAPKIDLWWVIFWLLSTKSLAVFYHAKADYRPRSILGPCLEVSCHFLGPPMVEFSNGMELGRPWLPSFFRNYTIIPSHFWTIFWPFPQGPWIFQHFCWGPYVLNFLIVLFDYSSFGILPSSDLAK